jgi:hypothetical protein
MDPYADFEAPRDIHFITEGGQVTHPSSGGLSKRLRDKITASNKAKKLLEDAVSKGATRDEIAALQDDRNYAIRLVRQCEWMFRSGYFREADPETTFRKTTNEGGLPSVVPHRLEFPPSAPP